MFNGENFITAKGVTLSREQSGENNLWVRLFLKGEGIVNVTSKNFMGASEPFIWANYNLRKKSKSQNYFIDDIDVKDDMLNIRRNRITIIIAFQWVQLLIKYVPHEQPDDNLLSNLYWNMKLLTEPKVLPDASNWRFIWKWLELWGLAPELVSFYASKNFNQDEILTLAQTLSLNTKGVIQMFSQPLKPLVRENVFKVAANLAVKFLDQI